MNQPHDPVAVRIDAAIASSDPAVSLDALAVALRDEGMEQRKMYEAFKAVALRHRDDQDETIWDAIADTMDRIVGWCGSHAKLFHTNLEM